MTAARGTHLPGGAWWRSVAGLVAVIIALLAGFSASACARPLVTGLTSLGGYQPAAFEHAKGAGVQFVRILVPWSEVAPERKPDSWNPEDPADPNYRWGSIDTGVSGAVEAGLTPIVLLDGVPKWAERCDIHLEGGPCNPDPAQFASFATAAARRYDGGFQGLPRVRYWQGFNEPNLSISFNPQFLKGRPTSPSLYRKLINSFYTAVKSVNRGNLVLMAGLGPIAVRNLTMGPMRFTRLLLCMAGDRNPHRSPSTCEGGVHFDIFDIHPYTTGGPNQKGGADDVEMGDLAKLQTLLKAADRAGRIHGKFGRTPLWITEFSWDSSPPDPGGLPMRTLTHWTAEAMYRAWAAGVSHFFWLSLRDNPPDPKLPPSETIEAGLYFRGPTIEEDRPKAVLKTFRFPFVAFKEKDGLSFWGRTPTSGPGRVAIELKGAGGWHRVTSTSASSSGIFTGTIGAHAAGRPRAARATYKGETAGPFSLKPIANFYQPPFG